jgi:hypothetical protein
MEKNMKSILDNLILGYPSPGEIWKDKLIDKKKVKIELIDGFQVQYKTQSEPNYQGVRITLTGRLHIAPFLELFTLDTQSPPL